MSDSARAEFMCGCYIMPEIPVVSLGDVYGGKLVAALDRQHPRDLFDVMQLFAHEGITPGIRRAFVVYLSSSNRPMLVVTGYRFEPSTHFATMR